MNKVAQIVFIIIAFYASDFCFAQVGINTTTPLSTLDINGNLSVKEIGILNSKVAGSGTLYGGTFANKTKINDGVYISITPSGSENDFELPDAAEVPGRIYIIRNISATNYAFLYSAGGGFFAKNSMNITPSPLNMAHDVVSKTLTFISDGLNWTYFN